MSLLGKILLFVNLLAAAGLCYASMANWGTRETINTNLALHVVALHGLPVDPVAGATSDSVALSLPAGAGRVIDEMRKSDLDKFLGGPAPTSQVEEVKAALGKLTAAADGAGGDAAALRYLCGGPDQRGVYTPGILASYAETFDERQKVRSLALAPAAQAGEARKQATDMLTAKFNAVTDKPQPAKLNDLSSAAAALKEKLNANPNDAEAVAATKAMASAGAPDFTRDDADRRKRIAQLLMLSDPSAQNQKRVMLLCGLNAYLAGVSDLTAKLEDIQRRTERSTEYDQGTFEDEYETLRRQALELDQLVLQQQRVTGSLQVQSAEDATALQRRERQLTDLQNELATLSKEVGDLLAVQAKIEAALYDVQKKVGDTLRGNAAKYGELTTAEAGKGR